MAGPLLNKEILPTKRWAGLIVFLYGIAFSLILYFFFLLIMFLFPCFLTFSDDFFY